MALAAGDRFGPYELLAPIGAGGMGEVWKARDTRLDRTVAVKVSQEKFSDRFEREARAVAALNHPNICTLHDVGPNYLVMEYIEGSPIRGPLPAAKGIEYAGQILDALDAAHRKGITHRDLKPGNILLAKQGIKLLDFGLARMMPGPDDSTLTQTGAVMGTPAYMAPEQWEGKTADARSDIFAFGCVLYEILSGKRATPDRKPLESASLESIVRTCLEKDPEDRWQSARDIKRALALAASQAVAVKQPSPVLVWIAVAAVVLAAIGGWALFHARPTVEETQTYRVQVALPQNGTLAPTPSNSNTLALSPNGRMAAFVVQANGKTGIWIQELDGMSARHLPGTEGAVLVLWSPDSKSVAFRVENRLFRSDLTSGSPVLICDMPAGPTWGADWGADGTSAGRILFEGNGTILQVSASGGRAEVLSQRDANSGGARNSPHMLPGGRFLYSTVTPPGVFGASLDHPDQRVQILSQSVTPLYEAGQDGKGYLVWTRDNTLVAQEFDPATLRLVSEAITIAPARNVTASAKLLLYDASTPMSQFAWVDRNGKELQTVGEPGSLTFTGLSRHGERVAVTVNSGDTTAANKIDLWLLETQRVGFSKFTFGPGIALSPVWSPDDQTIVFGSATGLVRKPSNGLGEEGKVLPYDRLLNPTDWSGDGIILYIRLARAPATTGLDVWMLPVTPDGKPTGDPKPYLDGPSDQDSAKFSPDGGWVAYQSNDSGRWEIYVDTFPKLSGPKQVSTGGGLGPRWNPKGGELFYRSLDGKLMAATIRLDKTSAAVSPPHVLFPMLVNAPPFGNAVYDVGPDGRFLIQVPAKQAPPLNMIVNWTALMKPTASR